MGDKSIFYVGGRAGGFFSGTCTLASEPILFPPDAKRYVLEDPQDRFNYFVNLKEVDLFPSPKPVKDMVKTLRFITSKESWWRHLQGSITNIYEEDFYAILNR